MSSLLCTICVQWHRQDLRVGGQEVWGTKSPAGSRANDDHSFITRLLFDNINIYSQHAMTYHNLFAPHLYSFAFCSTDQYSIDDDDVWR